MDLGRKRPLDLIDGCRHRLVKHLLETITPAFDNAKESLFGEAEKAASNEQQNRLFEALRVLSNGKIAFTERLSEHLNKTFERFVASDQSAQEADVETLHELALVDQKDLEQGLAIAEIVSKAEIKHTQAIYALNQRLAVLNRGRAVKNDSNPCGPLIIGNALRQAASPMELATQQKVLLYRAFDRLLQKQLGDCYQEINGALAEAGILPNIKLEMRHRAARAPTPPAQQDAVRRENTSSEATALQTPAGRDESLPLSDVAPTPQYEPEIDFFGRALQAATGTHASSTHTSPSSPQEAPLPLASIAHDIRQLMRQVRQHSAPVRGHAAVAPPQSIHAALSDLQQDAHRDPQANGFDIQRFKQQLTAALGADPATGKPFTLPESGAQTIDIMEMLYEHVDQEDNLNPPIQRLLKRLQVPMIKAAMQDDAFFDDGHHPARRLFNTIADAGELWLEDNPQDSKTLKKMQLAVDRVLEEYRDDMHVFKELLADLNKHIRLLSRKATIAERRHVEKARGQEKLELARERAQRLVDKFIKRYQPPKFIESLLRVPWSDLLALTVLRHGDESDAWDNAIKLARILIYSVRSDLDEAAKTKVRKNLAWLRSGLSEGLSQVGYFQQDIDAVLKDLEDCHRWSLSDKAADEAETEPEILSQAVASNHETHVEPAVPEPVVKKNKAKPLTARENSALAKLRLTAFGTWFEIKEGESDEWVKRKLSWFSPVTNHCLFVNNRGAIATQVHMHELAQAMSANRARLYRPRTKPVLDRALDAVFARLKKIAAKAKPA